MRKATSKSREKKIRGKRIGMRELHTLGTAGPSPGALGVSGAAAETDDGLFFVRISGNGIDEARKLENFANVPAGIEKLEAAAVAFERDERSHQSADAGAIHLRDAH